MKQDKIKVIGFIRHSDLSNVEVKVLTIDNTLKSMQEFVGGYIECVYLHDGILICNEEGKLHNLPKTVMLYDESVYNILDHVHGNCFLCCDDRDGEFCDLADIDRKFNNIMHGHFMNYRQVQYPLLPY